MERFARALVRWRWVVLAVWAVIGAVAAVRAPATPALLNIRGGSARETEASPGREAAQRAVQPPHQRVLRGHAGGPRAPGRGARPGGARFPARRRSTARAVRARAGLLSQHRRQHVPEPGPPVHLLPRRARPARPATAPARWCRCPPRGASDRSPASPTARATPPWSPAARRSTSTCASVVTEDSPAARRRSCRSP